MAMHEPASHTSQKAQSALTSQSAGEVDVGVGEVVGVGFFREVGGAGFFEAGWRGWVKVASGWGGGV